MKLRNKKTGKIIDSNELLTDRFILDLFSKDFEHFNKKLLEIQEEWEDYEEPETFFAIYYDGTISEFKDGDDEQIRDMKSIGNYFDTREEAEKAVEKLKAWKRLKDKGFRFKDFARLNDCAIIIRATSDEGWSEIYDDLNTCFGGEE